MTTSTLEELIALMDGPYNGPENQAILAYLQELDRIRKVKVPEPVELIRCGSCGLPDMVFLKDYNAILDLLRRETVAKEKAEAERDALRKTIHTALLTNGGVIDHADTVDGKAYVMVELAAFNELEAIDAAIAGKV